MSLTLRSRGRRKNTTNETARVPHVRTRSHTTDSAENRILSRPIADRNTTAPVIAMVQTSPRSARRARQRQRTLLTTLRIRFRACRLSESLMPSPFWPIPTYARWVEARHRLVLPTHPRLNPPRPPSLRRPSSRSSWRSPSRSRRGPTPRTGATARLVDIVLVLFVFFVIIFLFSSI